MMRSLYSGVSGLKNHQTRMDVVGNNISNVNTTGFKSSRVTFSDTLSQTLSGASSATENIGGINPKQIGLGSATSAIDTLFTDGSVQSTGVNTDLCLSGNGLFVVKNGDQTYYTRNGNFKFDESGYYVNSDGLKVQGWTADSDGNLNTTGTASYIQIPAGKGMAAQKTSVETYSNNLNASTTGYEIAGILVKYADGTSETVTNYTPTEPVQEHVEITTTTGTSFIVDKTSSYAFKTGESVDGKTLYSTTINSVTADTGKLSFALDTSTGVVNSLKPATVTGINSGTYSIGDSYTLSGVITKVTDNGTGKDGDVEIQFKATINGVTQTFTATVPPPDGTKTYQESETFSITLPIQSITATAGAKITTADGNSTELTDALTYNTKDQSYARIGKATDGDVLTVTTVSGTGYTFNGKEVASTTITTTDGASMDGLIGKDYAAKGTFYPSVTTTTTIYDTLGNAHTVPVLFTKTGENTWELALQGGGDSVTINETDGTTTTVSLTKSNLVFDSNGAYVSGSGSLALSYTNGAADQTVSLNLAAMTQYAGSSTAYATGDGNAAGSLKSVSIDSNGVITGTYTNGINRQEAQVAIAQFNNSSGLTKTGNSLYSESNNSGTANIGTVSALGCTVTPSALEMSNVDMASELTDMIVTQRGYQSNSKIITVSDELLETLINMKR